MDISIAELQTKRLREATSPDEYNLYQAALEWDLVEPIVIENREDLRSEQHWQNRVEPYHHQVTNLITFCRRLPVTLLADDVGLGKTISAGLIASELISRGRVLNILVVCPKLLIPQWIEELETKFGIPAIGATGTELSKLKLPQEPNATITTYHSARIHFDKIGKKGFEMLVLDEAHKLRNLYGVDPPPQVALRFREALANRLFKYVLMLTATPIQNRLWDLYSLVDLLTVARGHENPFGSEGMFARKFILDSRTNARQLRPKSKDEFRSIIYGYMSRVRRSDVKLQFPTRTVQLHKVDPTDEEVELIELTSKEIQKLNRLAQISILQALISSPHALATQLENMARRGTINRSFAIEVRNIVNKIQTTAKLQGLSNLVKELSTKQPNDWRMVVFTTRRETQTTIELFLEGQGIPCGLINGDSGLRNQQTIAKFKETPPEINVIVSTEAGSEGVNLQAANVLINFDLPWNPMIVEQRIGRIQRLASRHATVCIFNIILQDTFEEYIVGRLMEKLQLASHAIGDIEALLEAAGLDGEEESKSFAEKIRELVIASLEGTNVEEAVRLAEKSITDAKIELEREEKNINTMFGGMDGAIDLGPRCPKLPPPPRSMDFHAFIIQALKSIGANVSEEQSGEYKIDLDGRSEIIRFENSESINESTLCRPGSPFFERLVSRITNTGIHFVNDVDKNLLPQIKESIEDWVNSFTGLITSTQIKEIEPCFTGTALLRVRATVAHDSFERLIEINCSSKGNPTISKDALEPIGKYLENPDTLGLPIDFLRNKAMEDEGLTEFCRFYKERLTDEIASAGENLIKRKKLEDDFTPRLELSLVGLKGKMCRQIGLDVNYKIGGDNNYKSFLTLIPSEKKIVSRPELGTCNKTNAIVPCDCLAKCEISRVLALKHLLNSSDISRRMALPEYTTTCALSGKLVLSDEIEKSMISGKEIASSLLKTSAISGKRAEPEFFEKCEFSSSDVLKNELIISQISGKKYRKDEQAHSVVSGKTGHKSEFIICAETNQTLLPTEAEHSELTGKSIIPGLLEQCDITGKKVLPSELEKCVVTGKKALKKYFVTSNVSGAHLLEQEAVKSISGKYCTPKEAKLCHWSGNLYYPDDLRTCQLTNVSVYFEYTKNNGNICIEALNNLLNGVQLNTNRTDLWKTIASRASKAIGKGRCKVETAELSPDKQHLAVCLEVRTWLGLKVRQAGLLYSIKDNSIIGRIALGRRQAKGWQLES